MLNKSEGLTMAEKQEIALAGAKLFDTVETNLDRAHQGILKLVKTIEDGRGALMVGALETGMLKGEARAIAGKVGEAYHAVYALHRKLTDIAIKNEADLPQPRGGGDR